MEHVAAALHRARPHDPIARARRAAATAHPAARRARARGGSRRQPYHRRRRVRGPARRGIPRQPPRRRQLDVPPGGPPHGVHRRRSTGRGRRDRPQHRGQPGAGGRAAPGTGGGDGRAPAPPARAGIRHARDGPAAHRHSRALHAPRRADDAGPGVRDRRRAARVHAAAARAGRSRGPRDGRAPDVPERARRDPRDRRPRGARRDAPRRLGPRHVRGHVAAGGAAARVPDPRLPQSDRPDASGHRPRAARRPGARDADAARDRRDDGRAGARPGRAGDASDRPPTTPTARP